MTKRCLNNEFYYEIGENIELYIGSCNDTLLEKPYRLLSSKIESVEINNLDDITLNKPEKKYILNDNIISGVCIDFEEADRYKRIIYIITKENVEYKSFGIFILNSNRIFREELKIANVFINKKLKTQEENEMEEKKETKQLLTFVDDEGNELPPETIDEPNVEGIKEGEPDKNEPCLIKLNSETNVFVLNNYDAELLCDKLFGPIAKVSELLITGRLHEEHLPVNIESGEYTTQGEYVNLFKCSPCRVEKIVENDCMVIRRYIDKYEYKADDESDTVELDLFVKSIFIQGESVSQTYSNGDVEIFVSTVLSKTNIVAFALQSND